MPNIIKRKSEAPSTVTRRERPYDPFDRLQELMRWDPFREFDFPVAPFLGGQFTPAFELKETSDAYVFKADMPGIKESDLDLSLTGHRLTVSGKRDEESRHESDRYFTYERSYGTFSRSFTLPGDVDAERVTAELTDGVLTLSVPKAAGTEAKKIELKARGAKKAEA